VWKEGWWEAMAGTIIFYDAKGERQHTIYLGAVANATYPKDKIAYTAWLEDRCHQLNHIAASVPRHFIKK
jgi:hypothetical protein